MRFVAKACAGIDEFALLKDSIDSDVGLGKTIEAGLILREMLLRQRIKRVVISCPPSVLRQWQEEMASRFLISHALLRNSEYSAPLRVWLEQGKGGEDQAPLQSLLILDEAHNAAPASNTLRYAIDSGLTRSLRDLAPLFEHRIFLSATPHNGHSNSFTALLELLDPARFVRGVPFEPSDLDTVLVRRLKDDLRRIGEEFPERIVEPLSVPKRQPAGEYPGTGALAAAAEVPQAAGATADQGRSHEAAAQCRQAGDHQSAEAVAQLDRSLCPHPQGASQELGSEAGAAP
ncbi:MAG: hypothetical protein ACKN89_01525 [Cyanobium sp.]